MKKLPLLFLCLSLTAVGTVTLYSATWTVANKFGWVKRLIVNSLITDIYVTVNGTGNGSFSAPSSLSNALYRASTLGGLKRIWLRGGNYTNAAFVIQDTNLTVMAYPGESPILYGGQLLTSPTVSGGVATFTLPSFPANVTSAASSLTTWLVRSLLNGTTGNWLTQAAVGPLYHTNLSGDNAWDASPGKGKARLSRLTNDLVGEFGINTTNTELKLDSGFCDSLVGYTNYVNEAGTNYLDVSPILWAPAGSGFAATYWLRNNTNGWVNGGWMHDRVNGAVLVNDATATFVWVPATTRIFTLSKCRNVVVKGLQFRLTTTHNDMGGWACGFLDAAIKVTNSTAIILDTLTVKNVGGNGIDCQADDNGAVTVQNCDISYCGGTGIMAGNNTVTFTHRPIGPVTIANNLIHDVGLTRLGGVGISGGSTVAFNTVSNCSYDGILQVINNSLVTSNYMATTLLRARDGGGLHLSDCTNGTAAYNVIRDVKGTCYQVLDPGPYASLRFSRFGIYNDNYPRQNDIYCNLAQGCYWGIVLSDTLGGTVPADLCYITNNVHLSYTNWMRLAFEGTNGLVNYDRNLVYGNLGVNTGYTVGSTARSLSNVVAYVTGGLTNALPDTVTASHGLISMTSPNVRFTVGSAMKVAGAVDFDVSRVGYQKQLIPDYPYTP